MRAGERGRLGSTAARAEAGHGLLWLAGQARVWLRPLGQAASGQSLAVVGYGWLWLAGVGYGQPEQARGGQGWLGASHS